MKALTQAPHHQALKPGPYFQALLKGFSKTKSLRRLAGCLAH